MNMDEPGLIQSAQRGDINAFNHLVLEYQDMAFNVAYRILADQYGADDATQNAFISAFKNIKQYHGGSFRAWILRIVTNSCYDELRRRKRQPTTALEPVDPDGDEIDSPQWLEDKNPSPQEYAEAADLDQAIQDCLNGLPDEFKSMIVLIDIQGLDYEETSQALKTPLGTIKSRLARARMKMRDCLRGLQELLPAQFRLKGEGV